MTKDQEQIAIHLLRLFVSACMVEGWPRADDLPFRPVIGQGDFLAAKRLVEAIDGPFHIHGYEVAKEPTE